MKRVPGSANFRRQAMVALRSVAAATALLYLAGCASGLRAPRSLPPPPSSASRPGPWETSYAVYDPALFGPELSLTGLVNNTGSNSKRQAKKGQASHHQITAAARTLGWEKMVKAYRIQLGQNPAGQKKRQGDLRTPEGEYFICEHRPSTYQPRSDDFLSQCSGCQARTGGRLNQPERVRRD